MICAQDPTCATTCSNRNVFEDCPYRCDYERVILCGCPPGTIIDEDRNECVSPDECLQSMAAICIIIHYLLY